MAEPGADRTAAVLHVALIAGETSGDSLGAALMSELRARADTRFSGVGGPQMVAQGLDSLFPIDELAVVGFGGIVGNLPGLLDRIRAAADAVVAARADVLVIIDSPDFTHRVARRVRRRAPGIPIVDYVCPSVWAWRPWRARTMRRYVDHVLALLPFEPAALQRLSGPPGTYVGHPLAEQVGRLRPDEAQAHRRDSPPPIVLALPGSRTAEVRRMAPVFGAALELTAARTGLALEVVVPTVPRLLPLVDELTRSWNPRPRIVTDDEGKDAAFRTARAALAKSGTVTLELALAGVPTVAGYRVSAFEAAVARRLVNVPSVILANLVLGENAMPEFLQEDCTPDRVAQALAAIVRDTPERQRQLAAFARLDAIMEIGRARPSRRAAEIVLAAARSGR